MPRLDLVADCGSCAALCCVATSFDVSDDFAITKPAGTPCPHLTPTCRCAIHDDLATRGFRGCTVFTCHGAGPRITESLRRAPPAIRNAAFLTMLEIHTLLWLLTELAARCPPGLAAQLGAEIAALDVLAADRLPTLTSSRERRIRQLLKHCAHLAETIRSKGA